jgi:hypothetical protein
MMAFTSHFFKNKERKAWSPLIFALCKVWWVLCLTLLQPLHAQVPVRGAAQISAYKLEQSADGIYVSAQIQFELSPAVEDALQKGIPIFFVAQSELLEERWYWYDRSLALVQRHMRLSYQPLTRRWRLNVSQGVGSDNNPGQSINQNFDSLADALSAIRRISRWRVADAVPPDPDTRLQVMFSFRLDLDKLPRPFQIGNLGQTDWVISAGAKGAVPAEITK